MKDWELAEKIVKDIVGGRITPGSGNGKKKGDVWIDSDDWVFEIKQTSKEILTVQKAWLDRLDYCFPVTGLKDVCLVIFFELRGYPYVRELTPEHDNDTTWKTISVRENSLPAVLYNKGNTKWVLKSMSSLRNL